MTEFEGVVLLVLVCTGVLVVLLAVGTRKILDRLDAVEGRLMSYLDRNPRVEYKLIQPQSITADLITGSTRTMFDPHPDEDAQPEDDGTYDDWKSRSEDDGGQGDTGFDEVDKRRYRD